MVENADSDSKSQSVGESDSIDSAMKTDDVSDISKSEELVSAASEVVDAAGLGDGTISDKVEATGPSFGLGGDIDLDLDLEITEMKLDEAMLELSPGKGSKAD
jgi:hypothetical protein